MLSQSDLVTALLGYEVSMQAAILAARNVVLPAPLVRSFSTLGMARALALEIADQVPTGYRRDAEFVYTFSLAATNQVQTADILSAINECRDMQASVEYDGKKNICQTNRVGEGVRALYVGRSKKPRERLKQHLMESSSGTYAIHFEAWASDLDIPIEFRLYAFPGLESRVVQVIEDSLWDYLSPHLGRRGEK